MKTPVMVAFIFLATALYSQAPNQNISNYIFPDTEPFLAVNPVNPDNIIAAWMKATGLQQVSIAVSYSTNAGVTWSGPQNMAHLYPSWTSADPSITFNSSGTAYVCYVDYTYPSLDSGYAVVASSVNGGMSWSAPVPAVDGLSTPDKPVDRPWAVADNSGGTYDGNLYITTKNYENGITTNHVYFSRSTDNGLTWTPLTIIDDSIPCDLVTSMGALTVGADGTVYICYISYHTAQSIFPRLILSRSYDGGITFSENIITNVTAASVINDTLQGSLNLSANPADPNNLLIIVTDGRNGDADILCLKSNDGGNTWNANTPVRVNDDPVNNGNEQDMCWAGFSPSGTFGVAWRDRRNSGSGVTTPFEIWTATSINGGTSFAVNKKVSTALSNDIPLQKGNDFIGVALSNNFLFTNWCDYRTGNYEIFTNRDSLQSMVSTTGLKNEIPGILCFPNPFSDEISFSFTLAENTDNTRICIYDMNGKLIKKFFSGKLTKGKHEYTCNGKNLEAGNYLFSVEGEGLSLKKIFVKK